MSNPGDESTAPPATRREEVVETRHGVEVRDPYRWLEGDGEAVAQWTAAQNEYADAHLDSPTRERLRSAMEPLADVRDYGPVKAAGGRYFQTVERPEEDHPRLLVRESPGDEGHVLVAPAEWPANAAADAPTRSMAWHLPSPDGEHVAVGVTEGGDEQVDVHVLSVPDGEEVAVLADRGRVYLGLIGFDAVSPGMVAWDADGEGLYYVATGDPDAGAQMRTELRHWRFDGTESTLLANDDEQVWPTVRVGSGTLAVGLSAVGGGIDWYVHVDGELRPVLDDVDAETYVVFHDGTVFLQTDHGAPRGRVLACPLARFREGDLSLDECETVVPEREAVLQSFAVTSEHVVVYHLEDARARLAVHDRDGDRTRDLPLPDYASVSQLRADAVADRVFYQVESFHRPPTVVRADASSGDARELARVDVGVPDDLVVRQAFVESSGGTEVPLFVCHRAGVERDGDNPAVLHGYGGFRSGRPPNFDRFRVPFLADGGVYAQVCARGGDEYGESWHEDGMLAKKQHTFDDFVAAAEHLCSVGYTNPDRLAVTGRSNGGLSVGAVVTQRPDLWAAARSSVPLLDMLRFHEFLLGASWTAEYGNPGDPEAFASLREYSPYHNVEAGVEYPPVLFTTAAEDTRVHPAHARKMAARLQTEADGGPFLLRTRSDTGHGGGASTSSAVQEQVEEWTFLYDHLGVGE
ncbi:prolyl oligopeptidase family serine peptidase [Halomicrococcus gelatinilyticus]|uniref:prolyl oligopeptidase family serine peptidase n=1 Tax=Halomicrococcus gelatinilyticus TaxID=1702103 RepID=UPI002E15011F